MPAPLDALNYAKRMCSNMPVDDPNLNPRVLDDANKMLWMAAPWRWTVAPLEILTLANSTQDYATASHPDILFLVTGSITDGEQKSELVVTANLPSLGATPVIVGKPKRISYVPGTPQKIRVFPTPSGYTNPSNNPIPSMIIWYKQLSPTVTTNNQSQLYNTLTQTTGGPGTNVGYPDEWFWVYRETVLLYAYQFSHDARLGAVSFETSVDPKTGTPVTAVKYSGQYAVVMDAINQMKLTEKKFFDSIGTEVTVNG